MCLHLNQQRTELRTAEKVTTKFEGKLTKSKGNAPKFCRDAIQLATNLSPRNHCLKLIQTPGLLDLGQERENNDEHKIAKIKIRDLVHSAQRRQGRSSPARWRRIQSSRCEASSHGDGRPGPRSSSSSTPSATPFFLKLLLGRRRGGPTAGRGQAGPRRGAAGAARSGRRSAFSVGLLRPLLET